METAWFDYLANRKEFIPEMTDLLYGQWTDLFHPSGTSKDKLKDLLVGHQTKVTCTCNNGIECSYPPVGSCSH